jgi:acetolactate synthase-1/2/3 large subunit
MKQPELTISRVMLNTIHSYGVDKVFLVPGAQICHLMIELERYEGIDAILASHEMSAAYMAIGYARSSGRLGVVLSIGGPGAAYMVGAAITAKADKVPVIFITGDISTEPQSLGEFQDAGPEGTNNSGVYREAIGQSYLCRSEADMPDILAAIDSSESEKYPLHIRFPVNVQKARCSGMPDVDRRLPRKSDGLPLPSLRQANRVVIWLGALAVDELDGEALAVFLEENQLALVTDLSARGLISEESDHSLGFVGFQSDPRALMALNTTSSLCAEVVISFGVKPGALKQYVSEDLEVIEIAKTELLQLFRTQNLIAETNEVLERRSNWIEGFRSQRRIFPVPVETNSIVSYSNLVKQSSEIYPKHTRFFLGAGQIRKAGNLLLCCTESKTLIQSDSFAPMAHGVCAAIGVKLALPDVPVVSLFGDGTMRMRGIEIATAVKYDLVITHVLLDNKSNGMLLNKKHMERYAVSLKTDWSAFAKLLGIQCIEINNCVELTEALNFRVDATESILLWVKAGKSLGGELAQTNELEYKSWLTSVQQT